MAAADGAVLLSPSLTAPDIPGGLAGSPQLCSVMSDMASLDIGLITTACRGSSEDVECQAAALTAPEPDDSTCDVAVHHIDCSFPTATARADPQRRGALADAGTSGGAPLQLAEKRSASHEGLACAGGVLVRPGLPKSKSEDVGRLKTCTEASEEGAAAWGCSKQAVPVYSAVSPDPPTEASKKLPGAECARPALQQDNSSGATSASTPEASKEATAPAPGSPAPAKEPVTCHVAGLSWSGSKNGFKKVNQDAYSFMRTNDKKSLLFGVFDGHGPRGRDASQLVKQRLPDLLMDHGDALLHDTSDAFHLAFQKVQEEIVSNKPFDSSVSGTTAVVVHLHQRALTVAWAGDSRAVLAKTSPSGEALAVDLSEDHKPEKEQEKERIHANNGCVYRDVNEFGDDCGPFRVWMRQGPMLGLAMSRSIGDSLAHTVGVSATPEVRTVEITPEDHFLILASDGVWEFVSSEEAVRIVRSSPNPAIGAKRLMRHAREQWLSYDIGAYVDDITAVVVAFEHNHD